jgi:hypothetical protein
MKFGKDFDYHNFDRLAVTIKLDVEKEIVKRYSSFGWQEIERVEGRFFDVIHVLFIRPHKIANKDKLQLLQVNMELAVNRAARLEMNKNAKTAALSALVGLLGCGMIAGGVCLAVLLKGVLPIVFGSLLCTLGALEVVAFIPLLRKISKRERAEFQKNYSSAIDQIKVACASAAALSGGKNEK